MPRYSQTYLKLHHIMQESVVFQRYLDLIQLLEEKKQKTEKELQLTKMKLDQVKQNVEDTKEIIAKMGLLYRKIYGLSKQKLQVCRQFQELIDHLKSQLDHLVNSRKEINMRRKKSNAEKLLDLDSENIVVYKSKLKQMKMASLIERLQSKKENVGQNDTTLEFDEFNIEKQHLQTVRKLRRL